MRSVVVAFAGVMIGSVGAACGSVAEPGGAPEMRRGPVSLADAEAQLTSSTELSVSVLSCNGEPEVVALDESGEAIRLEVVTTQVVSGPSDGCLDVVAVVLRATRRPPTGRLRVRHDLAHHRHRGRRAPRMLRRGLPNRADVRHTRGGPRACPRGRRRGCARTERSGRIRTHRALGRLDRVRVRESADRYVTWSVVRNEEGR
jgi:hypothetical protein